MAPHQIEIRVPTHGRDAEEVRREVTRTLQVATRLLGWESYEANINLDPFEDAYIGRARMVVTLREVSKQTHRDIISEGAVRAFSAAIAEQLDRKLLGEL